jgi:phospholipid transport system substrate-binding protein
MKNFIIFCFFFLLSTTQISSLAGEPLPPEPAIDVIETLNTTLLECMKQGEKLGYSGRYALLEPVMTQAFAFDYMVSKSCGSHWKTLDSNQQAQLLDKYIIWSVGTYAERFKKHSGQRFEIVSSETIRGKYIKVISNIVKSGKKTRKFSYMLMDDKGNWRIVDIQVEGVSQLSLTRSQFRSVLKDQGFEGLLAVLNAKINKLNQEKTD